MTNNAEARAREVLAEHGIGAVSSSTLAAMLAYGNERAAQEREANAAIADFAADHCDGVEAGVARQVAKAIRDRKPAMTAPDTEAAQVAEIAGKLTKASKRALVRLQRDHWTSEGSPGPARDDAYSLWWGRDGKHRLVESPRAYAISSCGCSWKYRLTPLGLAVRHHLLTKDQQNG